MTMTPIQRHALVAEYERLMPEANSRNDGQPTTQQHRVMQSPNSIRLRTPPVWLASVDKIPVDELTSRSHSFVIVGDPGRGNKSGVGYYSISGDDKRGGVDIDSGFVRHVNRQKKDGSFVFPHGVRCTIDQLRDNSYISKEAFYLAYQKARMASCPHLSQRQVVEEVRLLSMLAPPEKMEMWQREPNGRTNPKPNLAERDIRSFERLSGTEEHSGKDFRELSDAEKHSGNALQFKHISIRHHPSADPLALLEAKRSLYVRRLYMDELHRRNGTGLPVYEPGQKPVSEERLRQVSSATPTYQKSPPFNGDLEGNCTTGAGTFLRQAHVREEDIKAPSPYSFGLHHRIRTWNPVKEQAQQDSHTSSREGIDSRPIRKTEVNTLALNGMLRAKTARLLHEESQQVSRLKAKL